jgi:hypothetical protein
MPIKRKYGGQHQIINQEGRCNEAGLGEGQVCARSGIWLAAAIKIPKPLWVGDKGSSACSQNKCPMGEKRARTIIALLPVRIIL